VSFYVYILYSSAHKRTYVGQTNNLSGRLEKHNKAQVRSTKAFVPWQLIHSEKFNTRAEAMRREKWYKSQVGRKKISEILNDFLNPETTGLSAPSDQSEGARSRPIGTD